MSKYTVSMKTKSGYNYKIILASVLFIVLTAVKLLFPAQTAGLRAQLREAAVSYTHLDVYKRQRYFR